MKTSNRALAGILVALGIAVAAVPQITKCEKHMAGCAGTAAAEIGVGAGIVLAALVVMLAAKPIARIIAASVAEGLSLASIALPLFITGTCKMDMMRCNTLMKPSLIVLGIIGAAVSLALLLGGIRDLKAGGPEGAE